MIRFALARVFKTLLAAVLTEKFLINLVLLLADWLAKRTQNDLDDRLVAHLRDALGKVKGQPARNLYDELKTLR